MRFSLIACVALPLSALALPQPAQPAKPNAAAKPRVPAPRAPAPRVPAPSQPQPAKPNTRPGAPAACVLRGKGGKNKRSNYCNDAYGRPVDGRASPGSEGHFSDSSSDGGFGYNLNLGPARSGVGCSEAVISQNGHARAYIQHVCGQQARDVRVVKSNHNCQSNSQGLGPGALYVCNGICSRASDSRFAGKEQGICYV